MLWNFFLVQPLSWSSLVVLRNPLFVAHHNLIKKCSLLLHRLREDNTSKQHFFFFFFGQHLRYSTYWAFSLSSCFKCQMTIEWSVLSSWATFFVVVRGSQWWWLSICCCQLLMAGHYASDLQGSHLCKTSWITTALYIRYLFVGQMHCWCCELSLLLLWPIFNSNLKSSYI